MARDKGYVTTVCGRKRRLPDLQLPEFEFKYMDGYASKNEDILDFDSVNDTFVPLQTQKYWLNKLQRCRFNQKQSIFKQANEDGIWIIDNGGKIADATRQCVNARIQGRRSSNCPYSFNPITQGCA